MDMQQIVAEKPIFTPAPQGAGIPTIAESLAAWEMDGKGPRPKIITAAWQGASLHFLLRLLWNVGYSFLYDVCMLNVEDTRKLWSLFNRLACEYLANASLVLDAGTGTGQTLVALLKASPNIKGIGADSSRSFLRRAQGNLGGLNNQNRAALFLKDLAQKPWPWPNAVFDAVTLHAVLQYLPRWAQIAILEEIYRVLTSGGTALLSYVREGFRYGGGVQELIKEKPGELLRVLPLIPSFVIWLVIAQKLGLATSISDEDFRKIIDRIGYREAEIVGQGYNGPDGPVVPIWRLVK